MPFYANRRIQGVYDRAQRIPVGKEDRIVLMSDLHRGTGSGADNFARNQNLFYVALSHYDREGFCYIELGDGDELWENSSFPQIATEYDHVFHMLRRLYRQGRFRMLWGNHDAVKKRGKWVSRNLIAYRDHRRLGEHSLFPGIWPDEGLVLQLEETGREILLLHGHQADYFNDRLWLLSKTMVRYLWRPLELIGVRDPTSSSANPSRRDNVERLLAAWSRRRDTMLIAGHTHRPIFPQPGEPMYFNDGSGVHPRYVTALELEGGRLSLVKWEVSAKPDGALFVTREVMEGPTAVEDFYTAGKAQAQAI